MMRTYDAVSLIDFYKVGHIDQYPKDTRQIFANWTPRNSRVPGADHIVWFGLQYFIKAILNEAWYATFFNRDKKVIIADYKELIKSTLGIENPRTDHIEKLHDLQYLPIKIYALPEGSNVPLGIPTLVITNTHPDFFWLPNYFETILSNILWKPCTSATTAQAYRKLFTKYVLESGETDLGFVNYMGHDFSFRGMSGREDAVLSGMGHLLSFNGTDTVPAIIGLHEYYGAPLTCGGSVPATEHSVMCAGFKDDEFNTFKRLITETYPSGIVSIVSDTWDLWKVLTEYVPALRDIILARNGRVVIRPDSGDPVNILCGEKHDNMWVYGQGNPKDYGTLRLLAHAMGVDANKSGLPVIRNMGAIYGDAITLERADQILNRTVNELKLSPYNLVFGIGSFTYEYVTRDSYGFAMKATAVDRGGVLYDIFKAPVTDDGGKKSAVGIPIVHESSEFTGSKGKYWLSQNGKPADLDNCAYNLVYCDSNLVREEKYEDIIKRVRQ